MNWQTVAIPLAAGIKPTSRGRVLDQTKLLVAQNCFFPQDEGPQKRYGHTTVPVETGDDPIGLNEIVPPDAPPLRTPFSLENPALSDYWLHGYGLIAQLTSDETTPGTFGKSPQPGVGVLHGMWQRDSEVVLWDGFRALSRPGAATQPFAEVTGEAVFPALRGAPIAKSAFGQFTPEAVDNGVLRTVAWIYDNNAYRSVFSSATGATLVNEEAFSFTGATSVRAVTLGPWTHLVVHDDALDELFIRSWHQDDPQTVTGRSLGPADSPSFDLKKVSETRAVVGKIDTEIMDITVLRQHGATEAAWTVDGDGNPGAVIALSSSIRGNLGIAWMTPGFDVYLRTFAMTSGVPLTNAIIVGITCQGLGRLTVSDNYNINNDVEAWTVYVEDGDVGELLTPRLLRVYSVDTNDTLQTTRYNTQLASHAFRVGQRSYVWCAGTPTVFELQQTWFLCDEKLMPVGKVLFGLANVPDATTYVLPSVTWHTSDADTATKDRFVFFGALGYRQRGNTDTEAADPNGVWLEPSAFFYALDFLPYLRSAQAGRSTYIAGAQLWEYDGANLNEAGFHLAPENYSIADGGAGNLNETKQYNWRIDLCYKNAQNEEVRSWSNTVSVAASAFGAATFKAEITIPHVPMTRRDNAYFLVFRTEGDGTEYYLVSSRDPSVTGTNGFVANDRTAASYTFTDNLADTVLIGREYHPANATGYIQPLPAPACELVTAGADRLWLAGGELNPGEIAPSRYFLPGETPSFSPALNIQVDRNSEPITAVGFVGEQAVFFRKTSTYTMAGEGPDNLAQGVWGQARLALADVGAIAQETLALAGEGLYFQSPSGIRVITQGGGLRPPGAGLLGGLGSDVDTLASEGEYSAAIVVPKFNQIRWYSRDPEKPGLAVDYTKNAFTTFTGLDCRGACFWNPGSTAILARGNAECWTEVEGRYLDGDRTYETIVRTAWLHGGNLGDFQRVRRWALFGDADTGLNLRYRVFYDERPFHAEEGQIEFNGNTNDSVWGDNTWGDGSWGDSNNPDGQSGLWFRDGVFRLRRRFARQKCSVFSIEFSDLSSDANFAPTVLALELGSKTGLDRIP